MWTGENRGFRKRLRQLGVKNIQHGIERSSVDRRKRCKKAGVDAKRFNRFQQSENGAFRKRIGVDTALVKHHLLSTDLHETYDDIRKKRQWISQDVEQRERHKSLVGRQHISRQYVDRKRGKGNLKARYLRKRVTTAIFANQSVQRRREWQSIEPCKVLLAPHVFWPRGGTLAFPGNGLVVGEAFSIWRN